ncbi:MAG: 4-hydroxy-tetrahydrodipicolinate reductase [Pseudomonadota bacterium]
MKTIRIAVSGAAGRMGRTLLGLIDAADDLALAGAWVRDEDGVAGRAVADWAGCGADVVATTDPADAFAGADVVVDFTLASATDTVLACVCDGRVPLVLGTTGLEDHTLQHLRQVAAVVPIVCERNMSAGVHVLSALVRAAAAALSDDYDIEIVEAHHRDKVDAPSGTALKLGEIAAAARGVNAADAAVRVRDGHTGARRRGSIGYAAVRAGGIVGEHTVILASDTERLELSHRTDDRRVFAAGALRAARWAGGREPGLYSMSDVLGLG